MGKPFEFKDGLKTFEKENFLNLGLLLSEIRSKVCNLSISKL